MAFLTSRSASKYVLFALGVSSDQVLQATPLQCHVRLVAVHVPSLHKSSIAKPRKMSNKCYRVCH